MPREMDNERFLGEVIKLLRDLQQEIAEMEDRSIGFITKKMLLINIQRVIRQAQTLKIKEQAKRILKNL